MKIQLKYTLLNLAFAGLLMAHAGTVLSQGFQSHESIKATAQAFLLSHLDNNRSPSMTIEVKIGRLDPRLKLPLCNMQLEPFLPTGANLNGNTSIGIRCQDNKPWSLYVSAKIIKYADIYVAKRYLPRGTQLTKSDITLERRDITSQSAGYITELEAISGKILRRPLRHNSVIPPSALHEPLLVKRGDKVTIVAQNAGIKVRMKGKALINGTEGETIKVRNLSSKRIIEGKVLSTGVVGVRL